MYTYSIIILKIARKINRNVDFPGFFEFSIRLSVNPHWKLRILIDINQGSALPSFSATNCVLRFPVTVSRKKERKNKKDRATPQKRSKRSQIWHGRISLIR